MHLAARDHLNCSLLKGLYTIHQVSLVNKQTAVRTSAFFDHSRRLRQPRQLLQSHIWRQPSTLRRACDTCAHKASALFVSNACQACPTWTMSPAKGSRVLCYHRHFICAPADEPCSSHSLQGSCKVQAVGMLIGCELGHQGCRDVHNHLLQTFMSLRGACLMLTAAAGGAVVVIAAPFERQGALDLAQDPLHRANALLNWHGASRPLPRLVVSACACDSSGL